MNTNRLKAVISILLIIATLGTFTACGSFEPCENCGETPTKGYENAYTGETEYYCSECSSDCAFCSNKATEYYTSLLGVIMFVCDDCYASIVGTDS